MGTHPLKKGDWKWIDLVLCDLMNSTSAPALRWSLYKQKQPGIVVKLCELLTQQVKPKLLCKLRALEITGLSRKAEGTATISTFDWALHSCFNLYSDGGASLVWCLSPTLTLPSIPLPLLIFMLKAWYATRRMWGLWYVREKYFLSWDDRYVCCRFLAESSDSQAWLSPRITAS